MRKGSKIYSVLKNRCPRCMEAPFFESDNPYKPGKMIRMLPECPVCGLSYTHEPGFYFGAMYVSYALAVALALAMGLLMHYAWNASFRNILFGIASVLVITSPVNFRLARLIWINIWIRYDPSSVKK